MKRLAAAWILPAAGLLAGCGAQTILLGTKGSYLFTTMDSLALPGEQVQLQARLQAGDFLQGQPGHVIRFHRNGELFKVAETDEAGVAAVTFQPDRAGDYVFNVEVAPIGVEEDLPEPRALLVACRGEDAPIVVVDMDKTLVASGFDAVLVGDPQPMQRSPQVMARIAETHTIVYLTHRPDYFGPKSKGWLRVHNYPAGPVLLSTIGGFLKGSGVYKSEMLRALKQKFRRIETGIGDKVSDAQAYHDNGLKAFLIISVSDSDSAESLTKLADAIKELPDKVQVVTHWGQIEQALYEGGSYPRSAAERMLRELAAKRTKDADT
jgi:hypothetical protein